MTKPARPLLVSVAQYEQELTAGTHTIFDVIETAHRLGADGVELRRETWANMVNEVSQARERIEELGLLVTFATHVTLFSADPENDAILRQDIDTAHGLGSPQLRVFQGPLPAADNDASWAAARAIVDYAAQQGIVIALENYVGTPGGTLAEITTVLDRIDSPALKTNIDIGNYTKHNEDVPNAIRTVGPRAVSAHLKDLTDNPDDPPTFLGDGNLPLAAILTELNALPQRLIYCFEFRGGGDPEGRIQQSVEYLRATSMP